MKILGLIPARGGSKGIPGKNIKMLHGKPLLHYTIETAVASNSLNRIVVSTDEEQIAAVAKAGGAQVPFMRPADLAADKSPTLGVILHALAFYRKQNINFDAVCLLQATSPMRTAENIKEAVAIFRAADTDSLISVIPVPHEYNPHWVFEPKEEGSSVLRISTGDSEIIPRRQELPPAFIRNGAIYLTKTSVLTEQQSIYGQSVAYYEMSADNHVNLDTPADWEKAERLFANQSIKL